MLATEVTVGFRAMLCNCNYWTVQVHFYDSLLSAACEIYMSLSYPEGQKMMD